jgi:hypothetical protein
MLIMELEWRMRLVKSRKANFTYLRGTDWYATTTTTKRTLVETEVM